MLKPGVKHTVTDEENNITYNVFAYRQLTQAETVAAVRFFYEQTKKGRIKKNKEYNIYTLIGHVK